MRKFPTKSLPLGALLMAVLVSVFAGCRAGDEVAPPAGNHSGRIIVKYRSAAVQPDAPGLLASLAGNSGGRVAYLGAAGGGAVVYSVTGLKDAAAFRALVEAIGHRGDVVYAEADRRVTRQRQE